MKLTLLLWCAVLLLQQPFCTRASDIESENSHNSSQIDDADVSPIEMNPDFEEYYGSEDSDSDSDSDLSDDEADSQLNPKKLAKSSISAALKKKKTQIAKKRTIITLALAVFAFRREILYSILHFLNKLFVNPRTGKLNLSLTQILKLVLFIDLMRKLQNTSGMRNGSWMNNSTNTNSKHAIEMLGLMNPLFGILVKSLITPNPAYIPSLYQHYTFERVNERHLKDGLALHKAIHSTHDEFKWPSSQSQVYENIERPIIKMPDGKKSNETAIILDLTKLGPSPSEDIRDKVSFVLSQYRHAAMITKDNISTGIEIVVILESPGGSAVDFGLAAQQLLRLRNEPGVLLTICVDRVAASGGYMLACTASPGRLFAAPFSVVGSIGVIGQIININELLERSGVSPIVFRGGKNKAPLGLIGKVTKHSIAKTQSMVDDTHRAFKQHVVDSRPILKERIENVGTGDVWLGSDAITLDLIDRITTSDEYISEKVSNGVRVLKMIKCPPRSLFFGRQLPPGATSMQAGSISALVQGFLAFVKNTVAMNQDPRILFREGMDSEKLPIAASTMDTPKMKL